MKEQVYAYLKTVPAGKVTTYGRIAQHLGKKNLARVVGNILHSNPDPERIPCHRVVNSKGQVAENYAFGKRMAEVCDIAILIGEKQSAPIRKGLLECGFPELFLFTAKNLDEATAILGHLVRPKDVILFENDLPDNYNEQ